MPLLSSTSNNDVIHQYQPLQQWHTRDDDNDDVVAYLPTKICGSNGHIDIGTDNCVKKRTNLSERILQKLG
jgi:hypothetical protein